MKKLQKQFCEKINITEKQFFGKEKIVGSLYLNSLTSIPEGFNPTVVGYLYLRSGLKCNYKNLDPDYIFEWQTGKYIKVDGIMNEVIHKKGNVRKVKIVGKTEESFLVTDGKNNWALGETLHKAKSDLQFKIISEKLKKEPITKDTLLTVRYYRLITGACSLGCENWLKQNNISYKKEGDEVIEDKPIKAVDLLPMLEKSGAYGIERFKSLITF